MILDTILASTRAAVSARKAELPERLLEEQVAGLGPTADLASALGSAGVSIIAEVKRASPSKGALALDLDPGQMAVSYAQAGAAAISVLTEVQHFHGSLADLVAVRDSLQAVGLCCPALRKDFIIDPYQLVEARACGADAILLIVAALDDEALARLFAGALALGLCPLVEVHDGAELTRALALQPPVIGINNRNLHDFGVDLETTRRLRPRVPPGTLVVSESGIHDAAQIRELRALGVDAVLIGEALVTSTDPGGTLRALLEAGR